MSEVQSLQMPKSTPKPRLSVGLSLALAALLIGAAALLFWKLSATLTSQAALVDGMVYTVSPEISAQLQSLLVQEGSSVEQGQVVAKMQVTSYNRELREASYEISSLAPPDMQEIANRLKAAEDAENDAIQRLAGVRHEEEAKQRQMEDAVLAHVQAQLAMRQPGADRASRAREARAREAMEQARENFETASRLRAAISQELARIRYEVQEAKRLASLNRYAQAKRPRSVAKPRTAEERGELSAPVAGTILKISAQPGQNLQRGEPLLIIVPKDAEQAFWVKAWFPQKDKDQLRPNLACKIIKDADGTIFSGHLESVLPSEALPGSHAKTDEFVPVRIALDDSKGLLPGDPVSCRLRLPWF
ncbi:MAG: HlyD family efflux transporter periplasmic adaptor subunit [Desulfovibrio sp.]|nr:HlyD family efflux transporter periplasmic adaptor subunit [Desulfovibrio sp.]